MKCETFECQETASETIEATEEAIELIGSLGLEGQKNLIVRKSDKSGGDDRCPYREITRQERFVYRVMCPDSSKLKEYDKGPIPLRVLQLAAHAESLCIFDELIVWHQSAHVEKDPVLVGLHQPAGKPTYEKKTFILARWGEELETFHVLLNRAIKSKRKQLVEQASSAMVKAKAIAASIESIDDDSIVKHGAEANISLSMPWGLIN